MSEKDIQFLTCLVFSSSTMLLFKLLPMLLISIYLSESRILEINRDQEVLEIMMFLKNISKVFLKSFKLAVYVDFDMYHINTNQENLFEQEEMPSLILETRNTRKRITGMEVHQAVLPSFIIVSLKNLQEVNGKMLLISQILIFASRIPYIFISKSGVINTMDVKMFMKQVWSFQVINFGLLQLHPNIQLMTFNPFTNVIENSTNPLEYNRNIFNNCCRNFFGKTIKIAFFENGQFVLEKQMKFAWTDENIWFNIIQTLNASHHLVQTKAFDYQNAIKIIMDGHADMCLHRYFVTEGRHSLDFFTSTEIEYMVALVPKAGKIPYSIYAISTLSPTLWLFIFIALVTLILTMIVIGKILSADIRKAVLDLVGVLFSQPVTRMSSYLTPQIFLFNFWRLACLVIIAAFQGALLKSLLIPKYFEEINTILDLRNSKLPIYPITDIQKQIEEASPILKEQLVNISEKNLIEQLLSGKTVKGAFIVTSSVADMLLEKQRKTGIKNIYHKMGEKITPGLTAYIFKKNLPYVTMFENMYLRMYQHGIIQRDRLNNKQEEKKDNNFKPLSMEHLQGIFYLMLFGEVIAVLIFLIEKFNNRFA